MDTNKDKLGDIPRDLTTRATALVFYLTKKTAPIMEECKYGSSFRFQLFIF